MQLFIMRHGEALFDAPDAKRCLSKQGIRQAHESAAWLAERMGNNLPMLRIWSSPFVRAQQTAAIVSEYLNKPIETYDWLTPDIPIERAMAQWETMWMQAEQASCWLWVSHMPLVGKLSGVFCEGLARLGQGFYPAQVQQLEADVWAAGCAVLKGEYLPYTRG